MMQRHFSYFAVLCSILMLGVFSGCSLSELDPDMASSESSIRVVGRVTPFHNIDTKSVKSNQESKITNMAMLVVDGNDAIVETQFVEDSKPLFIIDRSSANSPYSDADRFKNSRIYIIANIPYNSNNQSENKFIKKEGNSFYFLKPDGSHIGTIDDFLGTDYIVQEVGQPSIGFPMFGVSDELNLQKSSPLSGEVLEIPLTCLYSKVVFNLSVAPVQTVDGVKQRFTLTDWTVHNVPAKLRVQAPDKNAPTVNSTGTMLGDVTFTRTDNGLRFAEQNGKAMTFSFYMPEHKINPGSSVTYPTGMTDDEKQRYKPQLISDGQKATYITIRGIYTDHNSHDHEVSYDVYLGENNRDNFYINRDCQLNNNVYIKGITNTSDGTGVSLDWRVNVTQEPFTFSLERETLLDSHWEIRPIRIAFDTDHPQAKIQVEILNSATSNWIRMEKPSDPAGGDYCSVPSTDLAYGKRKYFTTDLVSSTLQANTRIDLSATDGLEQTIWVYVDENTEMPETDGSTVRSATVQCRYYEDGNTGGTATVSEDFTFRQRSLHHITYGGRNYGIEYFEEYLYNFDSKDNYDVTTDGMEWGLDGVQLSHLYDAVYIDISGGVLDFSNLVTTWLKEKYDPKYDFYITSQEALDGKAHYVPHGGLSFSKEIVAQAAIGARATNTKVKSAVEYCYNKNKRNSDGTVSNQNWYLPAIDEIEDICMGGYSSFEVFQDKYYWSSQPAYTVYKYKYSGFSSDEGNFYVENTNRARATKVDNNFTTEKSGDTVAAIQVNMQLGFSDPPVTANPVSTGATAEQIAAGRGKGNQPRAGSDAVNRIRCVYDYLVASHSYFGFESGTTEDIWTSSSFSRNTSTKNTGSASGQTTSASATITTTKAITRPGTLSFNYRHSNGTLRTITWSVSISSNGSSWTQIKSINGSDSWSTFNVDLSSYENVYIRITTTSTNILGSYATRNIDDIELDYRQEPGL